MKINKQQLIISILITILFVLSILFLGYRYNQNKQTYEREHIADLKNQVESVFESYLYFSEYVYETLIKDDDYVLNLIDTAYQSDEATQAILRQDLFNYLEDDYTILISHDFRQFHFHFPDSTSFLRLHRPDKFGDSLYDIRYSIRYVNNNHTFISGFEEGRIFNGYRYVYPLTYQNRHIGSVEVSVSMTSIIDYLSDIYDADFSFWMSRSAVEDTVFLDEQSNYRLTTWSDQYLIDIDMIESINQRNLFSNDELENIMSLLSSDEIHRLENNEEILINKKINGTHYSLAFINIRNIEGQDIAYFSSIMPDDQVVMNRNQFILNNTLITFIYFSVIALLYLTFRRNKLLSEDLMIDRLTNISNRRKFEIELNKIINSPSNGFALILLDIDDFKLVNDNYGHNIGDSVLKELSTLISNVLKPDFTLSRYGGEEFTILMPNTDKDMAIDIAEMIRHTVEQYNFKHVTKITISIGLYWTDKLNQIIDDIIKYADDAMYIAKSEGKNRVIVYNKTE